MIRRRFTKQLGRRVAMRADTSDIQTWVDTFQMEYHVPPEIHPNYVLDLGANIGLTAAHYAKMWPNAEVLAVEMDTRNSELCRLNFGGMVVNVAVGAYAGNGSYDHAGWQAGYSLNRPGSTLTQIVTITQILDDYLPAADEVFCKMDIEGAEWDIFSEGIDKRVKWLLVEVHGGGRFGPREGMKLLRADGFDTSLHMIHHSAIWATR